MKVAMGSVCVVAALVLILALLAMSSYNREVALRAQFEAQQKSNQSAFDRTWKTIAQESAVAVKERDTFREAYVEIMQNTKGVAGQGALAAFFTQAKVDISPAQFQRLMSTIESQRASFHRDQQKLLDIKAEHDTLRKSFLFQRLVGQRDELEATIVTSKKTDEAFESGAENDVAVFGE